MRPGREEKRLKTAVENADDQRMPTVPDPSIDALEACLVNAIEGLDASKDDPKVAEVQRSLKHRLYVEQANKDDALSKERRQIAEAVSRGEVPEGGMTVDELRGRLAELQHSRG